MPYVAKQEQTLGILVKLNKLQAFEKHCREGSSLPPLPIYLLLSKDTAKRRAAWEALRSSLLGECSPDLVLKSFQGERLTAAELGEELLSLSFFHERSLIYVDSADKLKTPVINILNTYLETPSPKQILILSGASLRSDQRLYKLCEKQGLVLDLPLQKAWEQERDLKQWVELAAQKANKALGAGVANALVQHATVQSDLLEQEWNKLLCYVAERPQITIKDCTALGIDDAQESIWELGTAIFRREAGRAVQIAHSLLQQGVALPLLLRQLRKQFQTDYQVAFILYSGGSSKDVMETFPYMRGRILEQHVQLAQRYGIQRFRLGILAIDEVDLLSRSRELSSTLCIDRLLTRLTR